MAEQIENEPRDKIYIGKNGNVLRTQKPGEPSKNPRGRMPGKNRATIFKKWMEMLSEGKNPVTGKNENMTIEDKMVLKMISRVLVDGDVQAFKEAMDSIYGKHRERVDYYSESDSVSGILNVPVRLTMEEWEKRFSR